MSKSEYRPGWFIMLGSLTAIGPLSIDMYLPSFPGIAASLHANSGAVQFTLAAFFIGLALGQAIYGPLADRFGRKPPLYFGLALYTVASIVCMLAPNIETLTAGRFVQALGGCAGMVIPRAIVRDHFSAQGSARAFSLLMLVMGLAPILAPILGSWILLIGNWRMLFGILACFGLICLVNIHFNLKESFQPSTQRSLNPLNILREYLSLLRDRHFSRYVLASGFANAGMFAYIAGSPFVLIEYYHLSPSAYAWIFGANAFGLIAASQINARLLKSHSVAELLRFSLWAPPVCGIILFGIALTGFGGLPVFLLALFGFIACGGFIGPNAGACALADQGQRAGMASALMGSLQFAIATLVSSAISLIPSHNALAMSGIMALCGITSFSIYHLLAPRQ